MFCRAGLLACLLVLFTQCARESARPAAQIAILRFENLSGDPSLDWMGRAFSEILSGELEGSPEQHVIPWSGLHSFDAPLGERPAAPGISAERTEALVAGAQAIVYGDFSVVNGVLRATATEEDPATRQMTRVVSANAPVSGGIFPVADALARRLGAAHSFGTQNPQALREFAEALDAADSAAALPRLAQAAAGDPGFGRAYVFWMDAALAHRNRAEAVRALAQARPRFSQFPELERARLNLGAAILDGGFQARLEAVKELARLDPADPGNHRTLAEALVSIRDYQGAVPEFRHALVLRPEDILALNAMGYAAAYAGDLPTAIRVLRGYEQLRPQEPNPLDSLGDVHFMLGHYREAEQFYLAARAKAPAFLNGGEFVKAAQARLMTGDVPGATALFQRFLAERQAARDPFAAYHAAAWSWQSGARRAAIRQMEQLARADEAGPLREIACRADAQAAIWLLALGDQAGAAARARQAVAEAVPATATAAATALFLTQPDGAPVPQAAPAFQENARAYKRLLAKDFAGALPLLQQIYRRPTTAPDDGLAVLLAWAYLETGQWQAAEPLLRLDPLPQATGLPAFAALYFPRQFFLRAEVLEKQGQHGQAAGYYQRFLALSGPDAEIWGEEARARAR